MRNKKIAATPNRSMAYPGKYRRRSAEAAEIRLTTPTPTLEQIKTMPIQVTRYRPDQVLNAACGEWEKLQSRKGNLTADALTVPQSVRNRWAIELLIKLAGYDRRLIELTWDAECGENAERLLRHRILERIATLYPEFAAEARQAM